MRRFMIVLAVAATLAAGGIGRAEGELATCKGTAPGGRSCSWTFSIADAMAVNLRLTPDIGYTGTLMARIVTNDAARLTKTTVGSYYAAGQAAPLTGNMVAETTIMLQPGSYKLIVESAKLLKACVGAGECYPDDRIPRADTIAAGGFAAEVVPTDATV